MRKYETVFISDPDLKDQVRTELFDRVREIITKEGGIILDFDEWGNKKLAYEIRKKTRGHYVCLTYGGTGALVAELERNFRLNESIMKFMTIVLSGDMTTQEIEAQAKATEEEEAETPVEEKPVETAAAEEPAAEEAQEAPKEEAPAEEDKEAQTEGE